MAGGQPRGCRRQIYERLSPRQVRRGSKHRGRAAPGAAGGSARIAPPTPSRAWLRPASPARRLPPGEGPSLLPAGGGGGVVVIIIFSVIFGVASYTFAPSRVLHRGWVRGRQPPRTHRRGERGPRRPGPALRGAPGPAGCGGRASPRAPPFPGQGNAASLLHHRPLLARGLTDHGATPPQVAKRTSPSAVSPGTE